MQLSEQLDVNQFSTTAPSGIAAFNIGGMTIHSFAGIGFGDAPVEQLLHEMGRRRNVRTPSECFRPFSPTCNAHCKGNCFVCFLEGAETVERHKSADH